MPFVLDSSVALAWVLPDERHDEAEKLLHRLTHDTAIVPAVWTLEIVNVLALAVRNGRLPRTQVDASVVQLHRLPIAIDPTPPDQSMDAILKLAEDLRLTAYDASYIECAVRTKLSFATLDKKLRSAAIKYGVDVLL